MLIVQSCSNRLDNMQQLASVEVTSLFAYCWRLHVFTEVKFAGKFAVLLQKKNNYHSVLQVSRVNFLYACKLLSCNDILNRKLSKCFKILQEVLEDNVLGSGSC